MKLDYNIKVEDGSIIHTSHIDTDIKYKEADLLSLVLSNIFWTPDNVRHICSQNKCTLKIIKRGVQK